MPSLAMCPACTTSTCQPKKLSFRMGTTQHRSVSQKEVCEGDICTDLSPVEGRAGARGHSWPPGHTCMIINRRTDDTYRG